MNNDERIFLSDSLKDIIDFESLLEEENQLKTNLKEFNTDFIIEIKFFNLDLPIFLNVFNLKKSKNLNIKCLEINTQEAIQFLKYKIESITIKTENQYTQLFDLKNYDILYSIQYKIKDNYKLSIKIKKRKD